MSEKQNLALKSMLYVVISAPFFYQFVQSDSSSLSESTHLVFKFIILPAVGALVLSHYLVVWGTVLNETKEPGVKNETDAKKNESNSPGQSKTKVSAKQRCQRRS